MSDLILSENKKKSFFAGLSKKIFIRYSNLHLKIVKWHLRKKPRFKPGKISILNWSIGYVDGAALASTIDLLLSKKINDFTTSNPSPIILDCGANIGISVLNYKRNYPNSKVFAFEPDPNIFPVLKNNISKNRAKDVKIINAAVWIENGTSNFFCEGADGSKLTPNSDSPSMIKVTTVDLADYISQPIDLIKMDIEGAEFEVIPHLKNRMHYIQNFLIECHFNSDEIEKFSTILQELGKAGFRVSVAVIGGWNDLIKKPIKIENGFEQNILVSAWR
jgi:FkbM family methyltransferase